MSIDLNITYRAADGNEITLTEAIVKGALAKGTVPVNSKDVYLYEKYCESKLLNPFVGDAYLIKYKAEKDADIVTSKNFLLKMLKKVPGYEWHQAGILLATNVDGVVKIDKHVGTYYLPAMQELIGGWAEVMLNGHLNYHDVSLADFNRGKNTWQQIPAVMIRKVALSQLCDDIAPDVFGGMYLEEELLMTKSEEENGSVKELRAKIAQLEGGKHAALAKSLTDLDALEMLYKGLVTEVEIEPVEMES